ncbi:MAG: hypothetical protein LBH75_04580 [Treponema sp.]|jgi:hypothetical protein|nr:hypothetical protein [Treponema sp.]
MYETMTLDSNTIIVKSDTKKELSDIIEFISAKDKEKNIEALLRLASENRKRVKNYKFSREECYERQNIH